MKVPLFAQFALYKPTDDDAFYTLKDGGEVNLDAVTHYATLGLKPRQIGPLVGCSHTVFWSNSQLKLAYERGAAFAVLYHKANMVDHSKDKPGLSVEALDRLIPREKDCLDGLDPEEAAEETAAVPQQIEVTVTKNVSKERQEIEAFLMAKIAAAEEKKA